MHTEKAPIIIVENIIFPLYPSSAKKKEEKKLLFKALSLA